LGELRGVRGAYHHRYLQEHRIIAPILAKDPSFTNVAISEQSSGGVFIGGVVPTPEDRERLRTTVTRALGESRAKEVMGVDVKP
jgi:hypothetical protein